MTTRTKLRITAGVVAPPPLLYAGAVTVGLLAKALFPVRFLPRTVTLTFGGPLVGSGLLLVLSGLRAMRRAGTEARPDRPTTSLVIDGPYRFTRNPLYLGLTLMYGGITALANSLPSDLLLPLVLLIMRRGVIEREQRYLERSFGEEYVQYKTRVRRWILNVYVVLGCSARAPSCRPVENVQHVDLPVELAGPAIPTRAEMHLLGPRQPLRRHPKKAHQAV